jgi:hypothetical protein
MRRIFRCTLLLISACLVIQFIGCSSSNESVDVRPERFPTRGKLTYNGKPAKGAAVTFWKLPLNLKSVDSWRQIRPAATVEADGSFVPSSYDLQDGAMAGTYAVTAIWTGENSEPGPDRFNGRFSNPEQPAMKVTIKKGENVLPPIDLNGPPIHPAASTKAGGL